MIFEIDDIKRRHVPYFDVYNVHGWVDAPDDTIKWNFLRSATAGFIGSAVNEMSYLFRMNYSLLRQKYEPPNNISQAKIYLNTIFKMDNFKNGIKNRLQYAFLFGGVNIGTRFAMWRGCNAGLPRTYETVNIEFWRKIIPSLVAAASTSWVLGPIEAAKNAYYADRTFPKEIRKNYKSIFNALYRIPREEGFYYLFKGSLPFVLESFIQTSVLFFSYDFLVDILNPCYDFSSFPFKSVKFFSAVVSSYLACVASYPLGSMLRTMVELTPKINGKTYFEGNYRQAAMFLYYQPLLLQSFVGFWNNGFLRNFPWMFTTVYVGESLGLFKFWKTNFLSYQGNNTYPNNWL